MSFGIGRTWLTSNNPLIGTKKIARMLVLRRHIQADSLLTKALLVSTLDGNGVVSPRTNAAGWRACYAHGQIVSLALMYFLQR